MVLFKFARRSLAAGFSRENFEERTRWRNFPMRRFRVVTLIRCGITRAGEHVQGGWHSHSLREPTRCVLSHWNLSKRACDVVLCVFFTLQCKRPCSTTRTPFLAQRKPRVSCDLRDVVSFDRAFTRCVGESVR